MKFLSIALSSAMLMLLAGCATTSNPCQSDNAVYQQKYRAAIANGQSEQAARKIANDACVDHQMGEMSKEVGL